jgi:antitoxin ParD1/3/4
VPIESATILSSDGLSGLHDLIFGTLAIYWQQLSAVVSSGGEEVISMETMNIALPESMKAFVQKRVAEGGYSSVSEYVRDLIRADQKLRQEERIDALLLEGLQSGEPVEVTKDYWEEKKRKLAARLSQAEDR